MVSHRKLRFTRASSIHVHPVLERQNQGLLCVMRIFACFHAHNAQEKSRTRLSSQFSSFIEKLSIPLWSSATPLEVQTLDVMNMTYTLSAEQKSCITLQGRKAANKALWAAEKADRRSLSVWEAKKPRKATKVAKKAAKLKAAAIEAVYASVSQTHSKPVIRMAAKPMEVKTQSVAAKSLKRKARKGPKDSNGKLEAKAQRESLANTQKRAAKTAPKVDVVWDEATNRRKEVEVEVKNPAKAHVITQTWMDYADVPEGLTMEDAVRYAALQDGYGCAADEVSMDDCL